MTCKLIVGSLKNYFLKVDVTTSTQHQHSSFDYEATVEQLSGTIHSDHQFQISHQFIHITRHQKDFKTVFKVQQSIKPQPLLPGFSHIGVFQIRYINKRVILRFYEPEDLVADKTFGKLSKQAINNKEIHQIYAVVRSFKNQNQQSIGYKIKQGSFIKLGQKQFFVSSVKSQRECTEGTIESKVMLIDSILNKHKKITIQDIKQPGECKYCMMEEGDTQGEFLCSPCKCSGSCAMVHFICLQKWNQSKVKKNQVKGLTYYNFQKFFCEVCKDEYPKFVEKGEKLYELMPIQMPKGEHIILQEIDLKSSSLICIENIQEQGIRMGRGNQCEIRVDSPSISRNHACIQKKFGDYYIFDNKSKFGTLVRESKIYLEVDSTRKGIQIDRSVLMFSICKKNYLS